MATSPEPIPGDPKAGMLARSAKASPGDPKAGMALTSTETSPADSRAGTIESSPKATSGHLEAGKMRKSPEAIPSDLKSRTGKKMSKSKRAQSHLVEKDVGHEEGPTDRPSCTSMEIRRSERLRKQPKRKPFSDLTNALPLPCPLSPSSTPDMTSAKSPSRIISNAIKNHEIQNLSILGSKEIPSDLDFDNDQTCSTSYVRQRPIGRNNKGKALVVEATSSCPQLERTRSTRGDLESEHADCHQPKSSSKQWFRMPKRVKKPVLPQDFIERQKAYFAEIDAFELPEEVVSESELE
ncbi:hypothetical protein J5N97_010588 [Dioscorea zingiberensis]|uniref:Sororin C-terminal region domain-containing protein n=1 Tax=Dioscorea zingiberensis TaxID=325984 RepID=A0A9D5CZP1_9LILI|nr:hypothetical protein J5N97_010588 [Dioscorea zingiberensis]